MRHALFPAAELSRHREAFFDLVQRARLAPPAQRDPLLRDAAMIALLHERLTGTPLLPDVAEYLCAGDDDTGPVA